MQSIRICKTIFASILTAALFALPALAADEKYGKGEKKDESKAGVTTDTKADTKADVKTDAKAKNMSLTATLVDPEKKAQEKAATVQVKVTGARIVDPASANEQPKSGQAHLHYKVDNGPVIATTATKLSFHDLPSGEHKITVMLAANDHQPLGPEQTLEVKIP